jgi:hypothetical protein
MMASTAAEAFAPFMLKGEDTHDGCVYAATSDHDPFVSLSIRRPDLRRDMLVLLFRAFQVEPNSEVDSDFRDGGETTSSGVSTGGIDVSYRERSRSMALVSSST